MADKTMPPSDPNESSEGNPQMVTDLAPEMPQGSPAEGSVMISVPESAFKTMHQMIVQIAQGFDQLAQGVYQQATGQTQGQPTAPEGEMPTQAPQGATGASSAPQGASDEDFLNEIATQGSQRNR